MKTSKPTCGTCKFFKISDWSCDDKQELFFVKPHHQACSQWQFRKPSCTDCQHWKPANPSMVTGECRIKKQINGLYELTHGDGRCNNWVSLEWSKN